MTNFDAIRPVHHHFASNELTPRPRKPRRKWKWLLLILILLAGISFVGYNLIAKTNKIFTGNQNIFQRITGLLISPDKPMIGEEEGQINILLMGVGGPGHDGPFLTDTMIVVSINTKTNEVILTSIPRDFMITLPNRGFQKINATYAYAEKDNPGTGGDAALQKLEELTGLKIPYYAMLDFKGFVKAVDDVGGVDITIDKTFTDSSFPDEDIGYIAPVTFTKGPEHMNGARALIFTRSRHGNNGEGSDFARSERQKKIISAMKEKALGLKLNDLKTLNNLLSTFTDSIRTNLEPYQLKRIADIATKVPAKAIYSFALDPDDKLICAGMIDLATGKPPVPIIVPPPVVTDPTLAPPAPSSKRSPTPTPKSSPTPAPTPIPVPISEDPTPTTANPPTTAYVVLPCNGKSVADIHKFLQNTSELAKLRKESAVVEIQNSTGKSGLAATKFKTLAGNGINARFTSFLGKVPYDQTILYDNSHGSKPNTLDYLKTKYSLTTSDINYTSSTADFVIILGKDAL
ncbi:MAG TPA: LCP family protein [Patescibacteria group bacterium]